jgi:hypothetical protein
VDRTLWIQSLTHDGCPAWRCALCRIGTLALVPKSLIHHETADSRFIGNEEAWEPERIKYTFTAWAECRNATCKQRYAIAGDGRVTSVQRPDGSFEWVDQFSPRSCSPMPDVFEIPSTCPQEVTAELRSAFALFLSSPAACAGRLRVALERLMDYVEVPRRKKNAAGKYYDLNLHKRIDAYKVEEPDIGENLIALKWLGNSGSHVGEVKADDLLDAFAIMEHSLAEIVDQRSQRVAQLAKQLSKRHRR